MKIDHTTNRYQWDGQKIAKPGVFSGVSIDFYHGDPCIGPSVSSSGLRTIWHESPADFWAFSPLNPKPFERKQSDALDLGKAAHHLLLGEAGFGEHFTVRPKEFKDYRSSAAQAWRDEQIASGKTVLTEDQIAAIYGMRDGLMRNDYVRGGILDGEVERSIFWQDDETGIWLRARPDVIPNSSGDYADLKTTDSVRYDDLSRTIAKFGYRMQAALLRMGCRALGLPFTSFSFVFAKKTPPFSARVVVIKDGELDRGERECRAAIRMFADGIKTGQWPEHEGAADDASFIEAPLWDQKQADERLDILEAEYSSKYKEAAE